jgi:hypothetical protein
MNQIKVMTLLQSTLICCAILTGCIDGIRYNRACEPPDSIVMADILGTWQIEYRNYSDSSLEESQRINGIERIVIHADGTYTQTFSGSASEYQSEVNQWELMREPDGPKIAMYGLKYFASGIENSESALLLKVQIADSLRFQAEYPPPNNVEADLTINYPEEGFVYLYPRNCLWKLGLVQMVAGSSDPDAIAVHNPVFEKLTE